MNSGNPERKIAEPESLPSGCYRETDVCPRQEPPGDPQEGKGNTVTSFCKAYIWRRVGFEVEAEGHPPRWLSSQASAFGSGRDPRGPGIESCIGLPAWSLLLPLPVSLPSVCVSLMNKFFKSCFKKGKNVV